MSRLVVVDASVVKAAGETQHPVSSACRECLLSIRNICHRVAQTDPIREEWKRHLSIFSRKWKCSMIARRKLPSVSRLVHLELRWDAYPDTARTAIKKDQKLIEAALATDCVIITLDDALKKALAKRRDGKEILRRIQWINPCDNGVEAIKKL